ncbi:Bug family tripartite tricarboxylate transporter substrate binding protein [Variovorax atrisoli]|uniref:Bug family tripartite tricarboxylate transporter substrate binding protein n=1 Tax=Variovorax atrisoli TaxID=3394203 RepID=UPI001611C3BD|nr:tripartite tricarboxylate transporter substrate binding protein [Variovorax sp. BK613]MBB3641527.1 tripartite-type tricarboxylate transporter receptor subunit TctC [Variovorax sp. BK613]
MSKAPSLAPILGLALVAALAVNVSAHAADTYPNKAVKVVVPYPPGGAVDQVTRRVAQKLTEQTGQSFFIDNKAGGTGTIGIGQVVRSAPDGYTLVANDLTYSILPYVFKKLPWDHDHDLVPIAAFNFAPVAVVVASDSKFKTLADLVAYAKANPGKLNYGTGGSGTMPHFGTEALKRAAGFEATHVPFKGNGEATMALLGNQIDFQLASTAGVISQVKGGKVRLLAISGAKRLNALPDVPTFAEAGFKGYSVVNFTGLWTPKGTPAPVVAKLQKEIVAAMASKDVQEFAESIGSVPNVLSGDEFTKLLRENSRLWGQVAESAQIEKQ